MASSRRKITATLALHGTRVASGLSYGHCSSIDSLSPHYDISTCRISTCTKCSWEFPKRERERERDKSREPLSRCQEAQVCVEQIGTWTAWHDALPLNVVQPFSPGPDL